MTETSLALLAYTLILARVIYQVGKNLGKQGYTTILIFYACEMISLGFYIYYVADPTKDISKGRVGTVPDVILYTALHSILFYYMYQLK